MSSMTMNSAVTMAGSFGGDSPAGGVRQYCPRTGRLIDQAPLMWEMLSEVGRPDGAVSQLGAADTALASERRCPKTPSKVSAR